MLIANTRFLALLPITDEILHRSHKEPNMLHIFDAWEF